MSRGALVGLAASAAVLLYRFRARWQVFVVACLLIGVAAVMPATFIDRVVSIGDPDDTGAGRTKIWAIGLDAAQRHGLFGSGLSTFLEVYTQTVALPPSKGGGRAGHNTYLTAWVELGIVGVVLLVAAVSCHLFQARRIGRLINATAVATRAAEAACYGVLVSVFFGDYLWTKYFWLPWILLAWGVQGRERPAPPPTRAPREQASGRLSRP
jgi:O-antigen ligase